MGVEPDRQRKVHIQSRAGDGRFRSGSEQDYWKHHGAIQDYSADNCGPLHPYSLCAGHATAANRDSGDRRLHEYFHNFHDFHLHHLDNEQHDFDNVHYLHDSFDVKLDNYVGYIFDNIFDYLDYLDYRVFRLSR